jgi:microcompartment protein CcmK/EutM
MILGTVEGNIVASQKDEGLRGFKLLLVRHVDLAMKPTGAYTIAADAVGAGEGEMVLVVTGSSARMAERTLEKPVDASVVAIVDSVSVEGRIAYDKSKPAEEASANAEEASAGAGKKTVAA